MDMFIDGTPVLTSIQLLTVADGKLYCTNAQVREMLKSCNVLLI